MTIPIHCCLTVDCSDGNAVDISTTKRLTSQSAKELRDYLDVYIRCLTRREIQDLKLQELPERAVEPTPPGGNG